jgi:hypothetical protein
MDKAQNSKSLKWGVPGLVIQTLGSFLPQIIGDADPNTMAIGTIVLMWVLMISGTAMFIVGLGYYAAAKGHSRWAGLLALLSIIGLIVLVCLPDRNKKPKEG